MDKLSERMDSFVRYVNKTDQRIVYLEKQLTWSKIIAITNKIPMQQATPPPPYPIHNPHFRSKPPAVHYVTGHKRICSEKITPGHM